MTRPAVVVARLDGAGDVLLAGPAVRAVARSAPVVFVHGPNGAGAAACLPGVTRRVEFDAPWIGIDDPEFDASRLDRFCDLVRASGARAAAILTSSHQSPLPLALLLRTAGVARIAGISVDHAGALLDHRIPGDPELHEVERALAVVRALGHEPDPDDDLRLAVEPMTSAPLHDDEPYLVVHPGCSVPARTLDPDRWRDVADTLSTAGHRVVVTGTPHERDLTRHVAAAGAQVCTPLSFQQLGQVVARAQAIVCGNTGPAHLAAAVGTPVVVVFAPTVPASRWRPWGVDHVLLGDQRVPCAGCRSRRCPIVGQPCLAAIDGAIVRDALASLGVGRSALEVA